MSYCVGYKCLHEVPASCALADVVEIVSSFWDFKRVGEVNSAVYISVDIIARAHCPRLHLLSLLQWKELPQELTKWHSAHFLPECIF